MPEAQETGQNEDLHLALLHEERRPPDRAEIIKVGSGIIRPGSPEWIRLQGIKIDSDTIHNGELQRGQLLDAGFTFLNRIGGGEKPILSADIPVGEREARHIVPLGTRVLLTQQELDAVRDFQQLDPLVYGTHGSDVETVRADMLAFLQQAVEVQNRSRQQEIGLFRQAQTLTLDDDSYTDDDRAAIGKFIREKLVLSQQESVDHLGYLMGECIAGIDLARLRGIPIAVVTQRLEKLKGSPSPFLASGFHFGTNYDATLYPNDPSKTKRVNMVNVHLLSQGINEMGGSINGSHDQSYMTAGEYATNIFSRRDSKETPYIPTQHEVRTVADRLLVRARSASGITGGN